MTPHPELEPRIADFYSREAPPRAPDWLLEETLATVHRTRQRRVIVRVPRRFPLMSLSARMAAAAAAVIVLGVAGILVLRPGTIPGVGGMGSPQASSSPSPSPSVIAPSASLPALGATFTSARNGISISYPAGWKISRAEQPWTSGLPPYCASACEDRMSEGETDAAFISVASQPIGALSGEAWATGILADKNWDATCPAETQPTTIDGAPAQIAVICPDRTLVALAWKDGRGYLIVLYRIDDRAWFQDLLTSVRLHPADAVDSTPSASPAP